MSRPRFLRFGLLATVAAMLIVISVAGWLRSELDLYREEQAILAEFAKAGCPAQAYRGTMDVASLNGDKQPGWTQYVPGWLKRVSWISVNGDPPDDLRRRAVALSTLKRFDVRPWVSKYPGSWSAPLPTFPPSESLLGRTLPEFREAVIDRETLAAPLPDGETIEGPEREEILEAVGEAWRSDAPRAPSRYAKRIDTTNVETMTVDLLRDGESFWCVQRGPHVATEERRLLTLCDSRNEFSLAYEEDRWRIEDQSDVDLPSFMRLRSAREFSEIGLPRTSWDDRRLNEAILSHVARVARVDGDRVRLEMDPFEVDYGVPPVNQESVAIETMTLILREDMNWAVSSERSGFVPTVSNVRGSPKRFVIERVFERRDGFVLPIEELGGSLFPPKRTRYAWELNPDIVPALFHPNRYLAEPLPPRTRPFPWWFVTLALGCLIGVYLILRKIVTSFGRQIRSAGPVEPAAEG
ncbi:MAG TPA: hypothetical protein VGN57_16100 [Pirellulaceae bacterium]|jgi:hypothetical protein|nr:hypothetical protein [Pirellulaceae bacterium]